VELARLTTKKNIEMRHRPILTLPHDLKIEIYQTISFDTSCTMSKERWKKFRDEEDFGLSFNYHLTHIFKVLFSMTEVE
jgi:hypothetical protein